MQDLNRNAETHTGSTFIIGSDSNDLIQGGQGNDYLEGRAGNDTFRDGGGYNVILGGQGEQQPATAAVGEGFQFRPRRGRDAVYARRPWRDQHHPRHRHVGQ
nr:hypothetical protein GCM10020185_76840 [Pseudomonas brassicacearum subsp. brassicacearum]